MASPLLRGCLVFLRALPEAVKKLNREILTYRGSKSTAQNARGARVPPRWRGRVGPLSPCAGLLLERPDLEFFHSSPAKEGNATGKRFTSLLASGALGPISNPLNDIQLPRPANLSIESDSGHSAVSSCYQVCYVLAYSVYCRAC